MTTSTIIFFTLGLVMVVAGAELLVRGASRLAVSFSVSPLVIGLTVVAYGTSSPELAVSLRAGLSGAADIAVGNILGSNIYNVLLILGLSALIVPLIVSVQLIRRDVPLMIGASLLLWAMSLDGKLGRIDGAVMAAGSVIYTWYSIRQGRRETQQKRAQGTDPSATDYGHPRAIGWLWPTGLVLAGLLALVAGAGWVKDGAVVVARLVGVSELVIALTIVAVGTSLPELATSVAAAIHGERDIAVGNIVGSNIFNILAIMGLTAMLTPRGLAVAQQARGFDLPVMIAVAVACLPIFTSGHLISRFEGAFFLLYGAAYTIYLIHTARHQQTPTMQGAAVLIFAAMLPAVTLIIICQRLFKAKPRAQTQST